MKAEPVCRMTTEIGPLDLFEFLPPVGVPDCTLGRGTAELADAVPCVADIASWVVVVDCACIEPVGLAVEFAAFIVADSSAGVGGASTSAPSAMGSDHHRFHVVAST